jgi:hypothetical protein
MRPRFLLAAGWLAAVVTVAAQRPSDFSGRWTLRAPEIATTPAVPAGVHGRAG